MSDNVRNRLLVEITKAGEELRLDNGPQGQGQAREGNLH